MQHVPFGGRVLPLRLLYEPDDGGRTQDLVAKYLLHISSEEMNAQITNLLLHI